MTREDARQLAETIINSGDAALGGGMIKAAIAVVVRAEREACVKTTARALRRLRDRRQERPMTLESPPDYEAACRAALGRIAELEGAIKRVIETWANGADGKEMAEAMIAASKTLSSAEQIAAGTPYVELMEG